MFSPEMHIFMLKTIMPYLKQCKNPVIVDLGFGSGWFTVALALLAMKINPN
jgi:tRNA G46 methylase TrmB